MPFFRPQIIAAGEGSHQTVWGRVSAAVCGGGVELMKDRDKKSQSPGARPLDKLTYYGKPAGRMNLDAIESNGPSHHPSSVSFVPHHNTNETAPGSVLVPDKFRAGHFYASIWREWAERLRKCEQSSNMQFSLRRMMDQIPAKVEAIYAELDSKEFILDNKLKKLYYKEFNRTTEGKLKCLYAQFCFGGAGFKLTHPVCHIRVCSNSVLGSGDVDPHLGSRR